MDHRVPFICWSDCVFRTKSVSSLSLSRVVLWQQPRPQWHQDIWSDVKLSLTSICVTWSDQRAATEYMKLTLIDLQHPSWIQRARLKVQHSWGMKVLMLHVPSLTVWASLWFVDFKFMSDDQSHLQLRPVTRTTWHQCEIRPKCFSPGRTCRIYDITTGLEPIRVQYETYTGTNTDTLHFYRFCGEMWTTQINIHSRSF